MTCGRLLARGIPFRIGRPGPELFGGPGAGKGGAGTPPGPSPVPRMRRPYGFPRSYPLDGGATMLKLLGLPPVALNGMNSTDIAA